MQAVLQNISEAGLSGTWSQVLATALGFDYNFGINWC